LRELRGPRRGRYSIRGTECVATNAAWRDQANGDDGSDDETGAHWSTAPCAASRNDQRE